MSYHNHTHAVSNYMLSRATETLRVAEQNAIALIRQATHGTNEMHLEQTITAIEANTNAVIAMLEAAHYQNEADAAAADNGAN